MIHGTNQACPRCGDHHPPRLTWQKCGNGQRHIRASCPRCGAFFRYVPQTRENVAQAMEPAQTQQELFQERLT